MNGCEECQNHFIFIREMSGNTNNNNNTQYFIDHERNVSSEQRSRGDDTGRFRVMRCFCGCSALTHDQIEHFVMMNVSSLINHPVGSTLFRNFLRIGHRTDKSEALNYYQCYELCRKIIQHFQLVHDQSIVDQLLSLCPSFTWEQRITDAFESGHKHKILEILNSLQQECVNSIECNNDYDRFRRELLRKIEK